MQLLQDSKSSYTWTNRACWTSFLALAGWSGSYAVNNTEELVGSWWGGGKDLTRLIVFIIFLSIIACYHHTELTHQNKEKMDILKTLEENQVLTEKSYRKIKSKFKSQCEKDTRNFRLAIVVFLIIIALPL